jgi:hypothetical protein
MGRQPYGNHDRAMPHLPASKRGSPPALNTLRRRVKRLAGLRK